VDIEWRDVLLRAVSGRAGSKIDGGEDTKVVTIENLLGDQLTISH
jgi:hypothetical protein